MTHSNLFPNAGSSVEEKELGQLLSQLPLPLMQSIPGTEKKRKVIVISGPTAVGKTKLSLEIAKVLDGEIVSADSMQVYRKMDIGTAKVSPEERRIVPHHLIDICDLSEPFNVMDFYQRAHRAIREILMRGKVPIVVGGTGFYIHSLIYGPPQGPPSVPKLRKDLEAEMDRCGTDVLYEKVRQLDPEYAKTITGADRHKIIRALEIMTLSNKKVSDFPKVQSQLIPYNYRCWFLFKSKETLYPQIEMRCDEMIASGFIDEVRVLEKMGLRNNSAASQAIGYRQCLEFIASSEAAEDFEKFVSSFKRASRRYAKRQFTWFRKEPFFRWLSVEGTDVKRSLETLLQDYELSF